MNFGTIAFNNKIYNVDYMSTDEMEKLLKKVSLEKKESFAKAKQIIKK